MKIRIKGTRLDLTPSIKEYVIDKIGGLQKFLKRFSDKGEPEADVEIERTSNHHKKGEVYRAEANLDLKSKGNRIRAEAKANDIRAAIDELKDTLKREVLEFKERQVDKKRSRKRPGKPKH